MTRLSVPKGESKEDGMLYLLEDGIRPILRPEERVPWNMPEKTKRRQLTGWNGHHRVITSSRCVGGRSRHPSDRVMSKPGK
jgi:hypothetical protein